MSPGGEGGGSASAILRIALALLVTISHAPHLALGPGAGQILFSPATGNLGDMAVNAFLALSGYYVTASALRHRGAVDFAKARIGRLGPALWLHAIAGAILAGALLSGDGPLRHLASADVWADAGRIAIGMWKDYAITGSDGIVGSAFSGNPDPRWNEPLWTIKYEIYCYAISGGLAMIAPHRPGRRRILWLSAAIMLAPTAMMLAEGGRQAMPWERLPACYAMGSIAFLIGAERLWLWAAAAAAALAAIAWPQAHIAQPLVWMGLAGASIAAATTPIRTNVPDVSYGLYIWSWPTAQALIATGVASEPLTLWMATVSISTAIALLSWHAVESPARALTRTKT